MYIHTWVYLGEVAAHVESILIILCHDVEQEGVCFVVVSLVVEEQLGYQADFLSICLDSAHIHTCMHEIHCKQFLCALTGKCTCTVPCFSSIYLEE